MVHLLFSCMKIILFLFPPHTFIYRADEKIKLIFTFSCLRCIHT